MHSMDQQWDNCTPVLIVMDCTRWSLSQPAHRRRHPAKGCLLFSFRKKIFLCSRIFHASLCQYYCSNVHETGIDQALYLLFVRVFGYGPHLGAWTWYYDRVLWFAITKLGWVPLRWWWWWWWRALHLEVGACAPWKQVHPMENGNHESWVVRDGTVDFRGNPADKRRTGGWKAAPLIFGSSHNCNRQCSQSLVITSCSH